MDGRTSPQSPSQADPGTGAKNLLDAITAYSEDAIVVRTLEGVVTQWNRGAEAVYGYSSAEVLGHRTPALVPSDRRLEEANILDCVARGETVAQFETRRMRKDGGLIEVVLTVTPISDAFGRITGATEVARDVTSLRNHQREIQRLSTLYSALSRINQIIVRTPSRQDLFRETCQILCDIGGFKAAWIGWMSNESRRVELAAAAGDTHGYLSTLRTFSLDHPEEGGISGKAYREGRYLVNNHVLDEPVMAERRDALRKSGFLSAASFPIRMGAYVHGTLTVYSGEEGFFRDREVALLEETAGDLSFGLENLARQATLREQARFLDAAREGIYVTDLDNRVTYWNKGAERIFGWTSEEMIGTPTVDRLFADPKAFEAARRETLAKGIMSVEMHKQTKDGRRITVETHATVVRGEDGSPKSVLVINIDVTDRKLLEAQFLRAQRLESIGALAGGIAHDLNNLLAPIMMGVDLLRSGDLSVQSRGIVDIIDRSARRGTDLVKQVLTFAKGSEGARIELNVAPIVKEVREIAENTFPKNITVATDIGRHLSLVMAQPTQINQVLMNLAVNARDAMPEGGRLRFGVRNTELGEADTRGKPEVPPGRYVCIEVSDTGCGMEPHVVDHIFEPFYTTKAPGKGTGLGLSTVQGIVRGAGGYISVQSEPGKGSCFRVFLPAMTPSGTPGVQRQAIETVPRGNGQLILVVDDEVSILQIARQTLTSFGYRVITAENGAHGIGLYAAEQAAISAIFTDLVMPVMDGRSLIAAARRINPKVVVVVATGAESPEDMRALEELGVSKVLTKPYAAEDLLRELHRALEPSSADDPDI